MDTPTITRRWWQRTPVRLSVRALMVVVLIVACGFGWVVNQAHAQRDAIQAIEKAGGKAFYDWQLKLIVTPDLEDLSSNVPNAKPDRPKWVIDWFGPDYYSTVKLVMIRGDADQVMSHVGRLTSLEEIDFMPISRTDPMMGPSDSGMEHLRGLTRLQHLNLGVSTAGGSLGAKRVTGRGLAAIAGATKLQILQLQGVPLKDADLAVLRGMSDLRHLFIESPEITDAGLEHLTGLVEMRNLGLQGTKVTSEGIKHLQGMTKLHQLNLALTVVESVETCRTLPGLDTLVLSRTPIGDAGLVPAAEPGFPNLVSLILFHTEVGDSGLMSLRDLPKLRRVSLAESKVTDAGVAEFKNARPTVNVTTKPPPPTPPRRPAVPAPK